MTSKMDYKKKLMEYRKSIGATTTSTIMRPMASRDLASNLNESDNQFKFTQENIQREQRLQKRTQLSFQEDNYSAGTRRSPIKEYRDFVGAAVASPITKTVSFQNSAPNLNIPDNQNNTLQLNNQQKQRQQRRNLLNIEDDNFVNEGRQSATRESSILRVSSSSPSPQPQSHQSLLQTPGCHRESSFLLEPIGRYVNWNSHHAFLASQPWCCIGDLMALCDKYEFKAISVLDAQLHANIVSEVRSLLSGKSPFDMRRRFPSNIRNPENLFVCIGRCPSIEYHLERILTAFRRPLNKLSTEKQNIAKQNFHLAVRELHLDISARISEIKLYDRNVFEKEFHLKWQDDLN